MDRRRRARDNDSGKLGKIVAAAALLVAIYLAVEFGLLNMVGEWMLAPLQPE